MHDKLLLIQNALTLSSLGYLRDRTTDTISFRKHSDILSKIIIQHLIQSKDLIQQNITTPVDTATISRIEKPFIALPILRSGIALLNPFLETVSNARVGFAGLARDETTAVAHEYYWKIPEPQKNDVIVILDPMIATGGSMLSVLRRLRRDLDNEIRIASIIAARPGLTAIQNEFPEVSIITTAIDETLNSHKYIVPGLGDFGDRYFGTEQPLATQP